MNVPFYGLLRKANRSVKLIKKRRAGGIISPCRRIERVSPPRERMCAMTFDDGPCEMPPNPGVPGGSGLTAHLLGVLKKYGVRGTFNIIGGTAENYPDEAGEAGGRYAFGTKYDHYAMFGRDGMAGAAACPELLRRMADEGHELSSHTYRHIIWGPSRTVYGSRVYMSGLDEALNDLRRLHGLVREITGVEMRFGRPPHYVDKMPDGKNAYDAYTEMGYHYLAASFDGGGWLPITGGYDDGVNAMVEPLKRALESNPDALNGQIIFQKDGFNMSLQTPVASALPLQLELLEKYGYKVVTASELTDASPFEDLRYDDPCFDAVSALEKAGYVTGFRNNCFYPDRRVTKNQLAALKHEGLEIPPGMTRRDFAVFFAKKVL